MSSAFEFTVTQPDRIEYTLLALQGPAGTSAVHLQRIAVGPIGSQRAVIAVGSSGVAYADCTAPEHMGRVLGISTGAADDGDLVTVQTADVLSDPSWAWVPDVDIYVGAVGVLTQTMPPNAAWWMRLGWALSATEMQIDMSEPVGFD